MLYKRINELLGTEYENDSEIKWDIICRCYKLSEDFIREFKDKVSWRIISNSQFLSEDFIRKYKNLLDWKGITVCQNLSEEFILEFKDRIDLDSLSSCQVLSENFIKNNMDMIDWDDISGCQILSEEFIDEFEDRLDWKEIAERQPFINPNHYTVLSFIDNYKNNFLNKEYQKTKERGWFFGAIQESCNSNFVLLGRDIVGDSYIKARVWWKDLIKTNITKYYDSPIRIIKGV